jgi:hypothetical protein
MMKKAVCFILFLLPVVLWAQYPFYYKIHAIKGSIYGVNGNRIDISIKNRKKLQVKNCKDPNLKAFLNVMMSTKTSRKYLEHLITTSACITVNIDEKVGILKYKGKYRLIAGLTGTEAGKSSDLIYDVGSNLVGKRKKHPKLVFRENTLSLFKGSVNYVHQKFKLDTSNTFIFDYDLKESITHFTMDTISIEPLLFPNLLYQNCIELYYFCGLHEIYHTTAQNIEIQIKDGDAAESGAYKLEFKAFKARKKINRKFSYLIPKKKS